MKLPKTVLTISTSLFVVIFVLLSVLNLYYADVHIPFVHVLGLTVLYFLFFGLLSMVFWQFMQEERRAKVLALLLFLILTFTVVPTVDCLVYVVFPWLGVQFYDESMPRNDAAFHYDIWRGYIFINAVALAFVFLLQFLERRSAARKADAELSDYRQQISGIAHTSHFLRTVFAGSFGRMLAEESPKNKQAKRDVIQFLGYLVRFDRPFAQVTWEEEVDQLECFARLLRAHYGAQAIELKIDQDGIDFPRLPWGILLFPLENCLRHALISPDYPIHYGLTIKSGMAVITCHNYWSPKEKDHDGGAGYRLLESKVLDTPYRLVCEGIRKKDTYELTIHLTWKHDE